MPKMTILDTNAVSELTRPTPNPQVLEWTARQPRETLYLTAITEAELRYGVALLPPSRRRDSLEAAVSRIIQICFANRILAFKSDAAQIRATRRITGRSISDLDCTISAIARANQAAIAARDANGLAGCAIQIINPWQN